MSKQKTATDWFELVANWESSGISAAAWCRRHELSYHCFLYWRRRRRESQPVDSDDNALSVMPHGGFYEIASPQGLTAEIAGVRIHLDRGFDPLLLQEAIVAIRGC